ncbi:tyrosine-type recombinase/integrase [Brevibacillus formosus]|uniref:tyrosine-type recombinase/integrase n=1 Tax=Brevibacillus formosus TaxID=54913 RepID=UPI001CA5EA54|nr:tyrosine-type recombinase/integrase [Brevibacillus formosus]
MNQRKLRGKLRAYASSSPQRHLTPSLSIEHSFELFLEAKIGEGLRDRTIQDYVSHQKYLTEWLVEKHPDITLIEQVTPKILRSYITYLTKEKQHFSGHPTKSNQAKNKFGLKPSTVNIRIATMKAFFNWLVKEHYLQLNPTENIKKQKVDEDTIGAFTEEQVSLLLDATDKRTYIGFRDYVMMQFFLQTGLRANEVASLSEKDLDFKNKLIILPGAKNKNRRTRVIPMGSKMLCLLKELIAENEVHFPAQEIIFLSNYGGPLTISAISDRIKYYGNRAGIRGGVRCSCHTFRHTFALNFLKSGADIVALQRILGHSSMDMVRKYVQHKTEDLQEAHKKYEEYRIKTTRNLMRTSRHFFP